MTKIRWRVGRHYGIHVYEGDRPVATFHHAADAEAAVAAYNAQIDAARLSDQDASEPLPSTP